MASELNMYESQVSEYKMDIERLSRELQEVKKKYFLQKKKEHLQRSVNGCIKLESISFMNCHLPLSWCVIREKERALAQGLAPPILPQSKADMPRFTGGGFNLKQSQQAMA